MSAAVNCRNCGYSGDSVTFDPLEPGRPDRCPECTSTDVVIDR